MAALKELPTVDWSDLATNKDKFMEDLRFALSDCGFLVLTNVPDFDDDFQQKAFKEVRGFFDAPMDIKKTSHISNTPYFRGYTLPTPADRGHGQVIENFQYGFEQVLFWCVKYIGALYCFGVPSAYILTIVFCNCHQEVFEQ